MFSNITFWNYKNYESGTQNSENAMLRTQDSYFFINFLLLRADPEVRLEYEGIVAESAKQDKRFRPF